MLQLNKENSVRCSNWEDIPLSESQLHYAALDAYVSFSHLFEHLKFMIKAFINCIYSSLAL